ncbi:MAG: FHA domain-containing protein [Clostridiales bacterium]|nr:MAG: FHA domain-containing protein [Clostridiales bacterium]
MYESYGIGEKRDNRQKKLYDTHKLPFLSKVHARIFFFTKTSFYVEDLGSTNGTFVGGKTGS